MEKIDSVVNDLSLNQYGDYDGETFVATLPDSNIFSNVYSKLSDDYEIDPSGNEFNDSKTFSVFTDDGIEIIASADYNNDNYTISIGAK